MEDSPFFYTDEDPTYVDSVNPSDVHRNPLGDLARNIAEIIDSAKLFEALVANPGTLRAFGGSLE